MTATTADWQWMRRAVDCGKRSVEETRSTAAPKVGVVAARDGDLVAEAFRGELSPGDHAQYCLLQKPHDSLRNATVYTTLEPCTSREHPKVPCAERLAASGIRAVFIGMYDPDPRIYRRGWRQLLDAGIDVGDFPAELRAEVRADNSAFLERFRAGIGERDSATFDFTQNGGRYDIRCDELEFTRRWTRRGHDSVYAVDNKNQVALARYAGSFEEIDQPEALDFGSHTVQVSVGEIVAFRTATEYLLVRIADVRVDPGPGAGRSQLSIDWQVRRRASG